MKATIGEKVFYFVNYILMTLAGLSCLLPLLHIVALSLSDSGSISAGLVSFYPIGWEWDSYQKLLGGTNIVEAFRNNVVITVVGVLLCMTFTILAAYPLSRSYFYGRRFFTLAIVFTMLFGGGLIPTYLLVKSLGLVNTYGALWLPGLVSAYNMLLLRTFFENIPEELIEASRIDGCSETRILLQILLPLSFPVLATLTLFYAVGFWNMFSSVLIYINDSSKFNLSVLVQNMIKSQTILQEVGELDADQVQRITPESIKSAAIVVMIVPMLCVYPFLQKYFVKGSMIGSIKG
ncbi:carbohydrate ABC transporter permease [Paenibacillus filicis]|uniref:Carbohydrate ABC transporter permease n=1 Tax=Paenibacillus gyeongsangnamensis TaxID=3388067 RepID=A0ABT4Q8L2_9BACL|nr:carbohydrate ABC transporter permease [Paenibacillus filicis]MCZ8513210.1 carbohydrate ABC transporter permease [Paenibacillus filicis]